MFQPALADTSCTISPTSLPDGAVGTVYSVTLTASGGTEPYTWSVVGGVLPDGLTLNSSTGAISGTPSVAEDYGFIVRADDSAGHYCTISISITINSTTETTNTRTISTLMLSKAGSFTLAENILTAARELASSDGRVRLSLAANTKINMQGSTLLGAATESKPPAAGDSSTLICAYSFMPSGATFSPAATMTLKYEKASLPAGALETNLYIAYWNGASWVELSSTVDTSAKEVSAPVSHFTVFSLRVTTEQSQATTTTSQGIAISTSILGTASSFNTSGGKTTSAVSVSDSGGKMKIALAENTTISLPVGSQQITVTKLDSAPNRPANTLMIEAYSFQPDNASFSPAASVAIKYDAAALPANVKETNLYLALLENSKWTAVSTTVDTKSKTLIAKISHFSTYAVLGKVTAAATTPATSNTTVPKSPTSNATTPSGNVTGPSANTSTSGNAATSGMAIPVIVIVVIGGLLVIGLGIAFVLRRR